MQRIRSIQELRELLANSQLEPDLLTKLEQCLTVEDVTREHNTVETLFLDESNEAISDSNGNTHETQAGITLLLEEEFNTIAPSGDTETTLFLDDDDLGLASASISTFNNVEIQDAEMKARIGRYEDISLLGAGGMGEVRMVRDVDLNRRLAMKIAHEQLVCSPAALSRFIEEAQVCAQLEHPNIVPVHELGELPDGRVYFTMKRIQGEEFAEVIQAVHSSSMGSQWRPAENGWSFRRLLNAFQEVCEAISFAHSRGVIHRDLKPENIMIGSYGEVLVVDWGLAKVLGRTGTEVHEDDWVSSDRKEEGRHLTRIGQVAGTPAYMPPEQAEGRIDKIDPRSDVYALGAILYEILVGHPPYQGDSGLDIIEQVRTRPPMPIAYFRSVGGDSHLSLDVKKAPGIGEIVKTKTGPTLPLDLVNACERAMAREPADRYSSAADLAKDVREWLEGARRREKALAIIEKAKKKGAEVELLDKRLETLIQSQAVEVNAWDPEEKKLELWGIEDEKERILQRREREDAEQEYLLRAAFTHMPELIEAHEALSHLYRRWHAVAERENDQRIELHAGLGLRRHAGVLPDEHPDKASHFVYLEGEGSLSISTAPPGAEILLERFDELQRRLQPVSLGRLGRSPIMGRGLAMGSYRLRIRKEGYHEIIYPICIRRLEHWNCIEPLQLTHASIPLLPLGSLGDDDIYVPAGWFASGGDIVALNGLPPRRLWLDGFIIRRHPVTNREYLAFLNDVLEKKGREEALLFAPKEGDDSEAESLFPFDDSGTFVLPSESGSEAFKEDWPICFVDWICAKAYARWEEERTGKGWRLPTDLEWEKAARGVDGRVYPWGDHFDPSWCCMGDSHEESSPSPVDLFPIDESPYGVRGTSGNMSDWTDSLWEPEGAEDTDGKVVLQLSDDDDDGDRVIRGGYWDDYPRRLRSAGRDDGAVEFRDNYLGFRLARSLSLTQSLR
jgi:eukaryotic-like serine/threonine-protein kinase